MNSKKEVQHVYLVGAKSLGAYGGYETFVYKLTEYHQNAWSELYLEADWYFSEPAKEELLHGQI